MVNNFDKAASWMYNMDEDEFFYVQVLVRGKDGHNANGNNTNRCIKYYTIRSFNEFEFARYEIKTLCDQFNARAYIHYGKRSFEQIGKEMLRTVTDRLISENWQGMKSAFQHCCGKCVLKKNKYYIVDVDWFDNEDQEDKDARLLRYKNFINFSCENIQDTNKVLEIIPTNNGCHLICKPFNINKFKNKFPDIDIKQDSPTLLYKA
jgi:hypothetical protein